MSSNRDREKASDVFRKSNFLFAQKVSFAEAFPTIATLKVVVERSGPGVYEWNRTQCFTSNVGEYVDCQNPVCFNGGFSVGSLLRQMVAENTKHLEVTKFCQGYEGSPKGKRRYRSCTSSFKITIDLEYKARVPPTV